MANLNIKCDRCGGKVMEDIISARYVDLHCIYCAKRWFFPKQKYLAFIKKVSKQYAEKRTANKRVLPA